MMISFQRIEYDQYVECYQDYREEATVYQSPDWLNFISITKRVKPAIYAVMSQNTMLGMIVGAEKRIGPWTLYGSPLSGWTTAYMGLLGCRDQDRWPLYCAFRQHLFTAEDAVFIQVLDRRLAAEDVPLDVPVDNYTGYVVALRDTDTEQLDDMSSACRRNVRKAIRVGLVSEIRWDETIVDCYYDMLLEVFERQNMKPTYDKARVRRLFNMEQPQERLFSVLIKTPSGKPAAVGIFTYDAKHMYFWGGASYSTTWHLRPNELLHWSALRYGRHMGLRYYDMGGGGDYKKKYGGTPISIPWVRMSKYEWVGTLRDMAYRTRKKIRKHMLLQ